MSRQMPTYDTLMNPLIKALKYLGGSGAIEEMYERVADQEGLSDDILSVMHNPEKSNQTEIQYRLAWTRTYLKKTGYLENSSRGVWSLTEKGRKCKDLDPAIIVAEVRRMEPNRINTQNEDDTPSWRAELHQILIEKLSPGAFERLTKRLLRELGFVHVEVTGQTGDGGIDGKGIARINGIMSFHVPFQCKKYKGSVGPGEIRDFRGAMAGRGEKGLFITTGSFTRAAKEEANRDGAPPIDLVDGDQLAEMLKELTLGVKTEMVEKVTIDPNWFLGL